MPDSEVAVLRREIRRLHAKVDEMQPALDESQARNDELVRETVRLRDACTL